MRTRQAAVFRKCWYLDAHVANRDLYISELQYWLHSYTGFFFCFNILLTVHLNIFILILTNLLH